MLKCHAFVRLQILSDLYWIIDAIAFPTQIQTQIHTKMMHSLKSQRQCRKLSCLVPFAVKCERCRSLHWLRVETPHHRVLDAWCGFRCMLSSFLTKVEATPLHHHILSCLSARQADFESTLEQSEGYNFQGYHECTLVRRHVGGCQRREWINLLVTPLKKYGLLKRSASE